MYPRMMPLEMTKQTLELRDLVESGVNIWDFDYPSYYKDAAKAEFEKKVIDHFYFRQIGAETVGRFLHYFRRTVREIMPLYIQRYESVDLMKDPEIRPLDNYNMIEELTRSTTEEGSENTTGTESTTGNSTGSGTTTGSSTGSGSKNSLESTSGVEAFSETPEGQLPFNVVTNTGGQTVTLGHASTVTQRTGQNALTESSTANEESSTTSETSGTTENSSETSGTSETSRTGSETHKLTRRGNIGVTTYAQLLEGYRQTFLNIDMEIIKELETCFLGVY